MSTKKGQGARATEASRAEIAKYEIRFAFFRHVITAIGWVVGVWIALAGLEPILIYGKAEEIHAFSKVVSALRPGSAIGYFLAAVMFSLYKIERRGKKRAIKEKSKWQKLAEQAEPNRTSSNLTETGDTPNGRRHHE